MMKSYKFPNNKGDTVNPANRFNVLLEKYQDDPQYVAEGLLIDINEQIVRLLEQKEITRSALAQALGVSNPYVTKLLNGNENLTIKQLVRLAIALECCIDLAFVPKQFSVNRLFSYVPRRIEAEGFNESVELEESDENNLPIAA